MEKINKFILSDIICSVGPWPQIILMSTVCKKWNLLIKSSYHKFTLQGIRYPHLIPCNIKIENYFKSFFVNYKFHTLDLRNIEISSELLSKILVIQINLQVLDLTNTTVEIGKIWEEMIKTEPNKLFLNLEELRITNNYSIDLGYQNLVQIYPNLKILYAGNTFTDINDFITITTKLKKLQILDVMFSLIDYQKFCKLDFYELLQDTSLKILFFQIYDIKTLQILSILNIKVITKYIGDILFKISSENLYSLEDFISIGGDVNILFTSKSGGISIIVNPQVEVLKIVPNDDLLVKIFQMLIKGKLDLSNHLLNQDTILNYAIFYSYTKLSELLIRSGSDLSPKLSTFHEKLTSLFVAATRKNFQIIDLFFELGLEKINYYTNIYCNPLCISALQNDIVLFEYLINKNFPIFHCRKHPKILKLHFGIPKIVFDPKFKHKFDFSSLDFYKACKFYLIKRQEDNAILMVESFSEEFKMIEKKRFDKEFLKISKKFKIQSNKKPLLMLACENFNIHFVRACINRGFDINITDNHGWSPLESSCSFGNVEIAHLLLENGADVNHKDCWGKSPLHQASQNGHKNCVEILLQWGGDAFSRCREGLTPLFYAINNQRAEILNLFRDKGFSIEIKKKNIGIKDFIT